MANGQWLKRLKYDQWLGCHFIHVYQVVDGIEHCIGVRHVTPKDLKDFGIEE